MNVLAAFVNLNQFQEREKAAQRVSFGARHPADVHGDIPSEVRKQVLCKRYFVRAARVQNEFAPENVLNRYEKRFEKREKGSEKRSETRLKHF